ncbi:MAG: hypothetical protein ABI688_00130 [Bacteroidota bacterium]
MSLATYKFLPWLRDGIGNTITEEDTLTNGGSVGGRAILSLQVDINNQDAGTKDFRIVGPADVIGFSHDLVIRTEPANWSTVFPPNLLANIEFYDEDFPWRYSPAKAKADKLRPWISVFVLKESEFTRNQDVLPLPRIELNDASMLPDTTQSWLWAHVQKIESSTLPVDKSTSDHIISRLVSPRKLEPNTAYYAFVVPTFETGRIAGLGKGEDEIKILNTQDPSWGKGQMEFPVYYEWHFRTADEMDFEYLASLLEPRTVDPMVGKKLLDCSSPGFGIEDYTSELNLYIQGALRAPDSPGVLNVSITSSANLDDFESRVSQLINERTNAAGDPIVTPTFYGQKHIFEESLDPNKETWIHQLNSDPSFRAVAGIGAQVFKKYQDQYLEKAWSQLESIVEANKMIDAANSNIAVCAMIYGKNIQALAQEEMISFTAPVHVKIRVKDTNSNISTLSEAFYRSCFNGSVYTSAFRRLTSRRGTFRRKLEANGVPLNLELLKKLIIANTNRKYILGDPIKYRVLVIDRPKFVFDPNFGDRAPAIDIPAFGQAINAFVNIIKNPIENEPCSVDVLHDLPQSIDPLQTIRIVLLKRLEMPVPGWFDDPYRIKPACAYPDFEDPMYLKLMEVSKEWLAPNLSLIPSNSITLLESNRKFIESFMVGLNVSMNKEMRWREYPTDERGSCFRQFWDVKGIKNINDAASNTAAVVEKFKDITPIHTWKNWGNKAGKEELDEFGKHGNRSSLKEEDQLVLVLRGDLLKCFPNTTIYAAKAEEITDTNNEKKLQIKDGVKPKLPVFNAEAGGDLKFLGFDLSVAEAIGIGTDAGWFFVIQETPGETRFGLDIQAPDPAATQLSWEDAHWGIVTGKNISVTDDVAALTAKMTASEKNRWGRSSADMAYILYQDPVMIAIHAKEMLT